MRILHLADRLTERSGAHRHLLAVLEALHEAGHEVCLAVGRDEGATAPCRTDVVAGLEARTRRAADLDGIVSGFRPELVHVHTVVNPAVLEWAAGRPALITVQDHRYFCATRGKWTRAGEICREAMRREPCAACLEDEAYFGEIYALTAERLALLRRLRAVVLSRYMKGELVAAGVPEERIAVVPPFVHGLDPAAAPDGPPCVLFVGRLAEAKGVRDAVAAWRLSGVALPLVFAGTGPLRAWLEAEGFRVLGWLDRARLSAAYRRARVVLMPPRWQEPFGLAGLEALALGVPVVAWVSGGIAEWHPGDGLVAWGDVAGLARALRAAVGRMAAPAPGFERDALQRRLLAAYDSALAAPAAAVS